MNRMTEAALIAVAALGMTASARAQYANGDLLVGFTGGTTDFILDLGPYSNLTLGQTWNVGANRGTQFGVVGAQSSGQHIFATSDDPAENGFSPLGLYFNARGNITTMAGGLTVGQSRTPDPSDTTSWTYQTAQSAGTPGNTFQNNFFNPNVSVTGTAYLFDNASLDGSVNANSFFKYDSASGTLAYATVVPEPSTAALLGGMGLLGLAYARRFVRKA